MQSNSKKMNKTLKTLSLDLVLRQVAFFEGFRSRPYRCPSGVLTIGYGHTDGVKPSDCVTVDKALDLLWSDFLSAQSLLLKSFDLMYSMNKNQINALTDFVFNLGIGALQRSSAAPFLKKYYCVSSSTRKSYDAAIVSCLLKYNKYRKNGKLVVSDGLKKRREWEAALYLSS